MPTATQDIPARRGSVRDPYATLPPKPCRICGEPIQPARARLEKTTCLECQADLDLSEPTQHLIAIPYNKGAYQYIHNPADLFGTNPKQPRGA